VSVIADIALKICGITQVDQAVTIASLGVDYLGFICVPSSPRYRDPATFATIRQELCTRLPQPPRTVGVFVNATEMELRAVQEQVQFDVLQLHGQESAAFCQGVQHQFPEVQVWKAFRIRDPADLAQVKDYEAIVDGILLDAYHPHLLGGTGETIDWSILGRFNPKCPWFLAGGLTPNNISLALQHLSPCGIDVSSGVERSPGDKDLSLVQQLITQMGAKP
jgi:phosphoribosylanthranilate isomerase